MTRRPRVAVVLVGGTIDSVGASRLDLAWYHEHGQRQAPDALLGHLRELEDPVEAWPVEFRRVPSHALSSADWIELARVVSALAGDADGVVVTHGTNTLEETAYFLQLVVESSAPVVLVGAMRPASALGADGPLNLVRAVQVAADPSSRDRGVLVVMNDTIHAARDVTKRATFRVEAMQSADLGPLGYADADGRVVYYHQHLRAAPDAPRFDLADRTELPRVDVVLSHVGADGALIDAARLAGARGIVSAGSGAGRVTPAEQEALDRAGRAGVVVCHGSRIAAGRVVRTPSMADRGAVAADNLPPWKARVLLSLALTVTTSADEIQEMFDERW